MAARYVVMAAMAPSSAGSIGVEPVGAVLSSESLMALALPGSGAMSTGRFS
ncbi:MAG: hypothetical protein WKG00_09335 [Polyangiaceae bacterium]